MTSSSRTRDVGRRPTTGSRSASTSAPCPGRAVVVRVADGAEVGSAVHEYAHAVMDEPADGEPAVGGRRAAAGLGAAGAQRLRRRAQDRRPGRRPGRRHRPAAGRRGRHRLHGLHDPARCSPTARPCASCRSTPTARTPTSSSGSTTPRKPHADRINELAHRRGEPWISRYGGLISSEWEFAKGLAAPGGGPGDLPPDGSFRRGGRLDRLAADRPVRPQRVHRRLQGDLPGRPIPDRDFLGSLNPDFAGFAEDKLAHEIGQLGDVGRRAHRRGRRVDRPARGHRGRRRQRRRPRHRTRGPGDRARPDGRDHGHVDVSRR